jgi:hypothetical protein
MTLAHVYFYGFIGLVVALWYYLGVSFDIAFLIVGGTTVLLVYWFYIRESPSKPPVDGDAKLADSKELEKSGVSRDR